MWWAIPPRSPNFLPTASVLDFLEALVYVPQTEAGELDNLHRLGKPRRSCTLITDAMVAMMEEQ